MSTMATIQIDSGLPVSWRHHMAQIASSDIQAIVEVAAILVRHVVHGTKLNPAVVAALFAMGKASDSICEGGR